jgi:hypothetical protein
MSQLLYAVAKRTANITPTAMSQPYSSLPEGASSTETSSTERKRSLSISSIGSGSDISYNDPLDVEPFDEKRGTDSRFQDEPALEDGDEGSRFLGSRRVSHTLICYTKI